MNIIKDMDKTSIRYWINRNKKITSMFNTMNCLSKLEKIHVEKYCTLFKDLRFEIRWKML